MSGMKLITQRTTIYFLLTTFFTGCAGLAVREDVRFPIQKLYVNNKPYYPLPEVCAHLRLECEYDAISRQITLRKADTEVKLLIDSAMVLVNGAPWDIEEPVIMDRGMVIVPVKFKAAVLDRFYCQVLAQEKPGYALIPRIRRVVVDAGHGGHDPGAIGRTGLREKDVNLDIARRLESLLRNRGIEVVMTRSVDKFISLEGRAVIANRANADFFISVHSNSASSSRLNGFEVYYITEKVNDYSRALRAASSADLNFESASFYQATLDLKAALWDILYTQNRAEAIVLAQNICQSAGRSMGVKILGVKGARFSVLRGTHIPAVLIEVGFLSHPLEERYLRNGFYRQQVAESICEGIINYSRQYDLASASYK